MNTTHSFASVRGYAEVLLEEIALEGLDGITLETLWKRLELNPDWNLNISDNLVEEFVWKHLLSLRDIQWFLLKLPRACPVIFSSIEKYIDAAEKNIIDLNTYSSNAYPHSFVNEDNVIGSCPTYYDRIDVTEEVQKVSVIEAKEKWGNKLVIVASQRVRYDVLLPGNENPEFELAETTYCILERIGRGRRCGELAAALTFLKNGANPIFYFWNKLKRKKIIKSQSVALGGKITYSTLLHLPKFYKKYTSEVTNSIIDIVNQIQSSPKKACLFSEINNPYFASKRKIIKLDSFRRFVKGTYIAYKEYFPESDESQWVTQNGDTKLVRVYTLVNKNLDPKTMFDDRNSEDEHENENGILEENRIFNRTLISQCYNLIDKAKTEGTSMVEIGRKLGLNKLMTRQLLKTLTKYNLIVSLSSENARVRYYRYYSNNYSSDVKKKLQEQLNKTFEILEMNSSKSNPNSELKNDVVSETSENKVNLIENPPKKSTKRKLSKDKKDNDAKRKKTESVKEDAKLTAPSENPISDEISTKMSLATEHVIPANESMFVMRRINIILEYVYRNNAVSKSLLAKIVSDEESKRGLSQGFPDRKSLIKVVNILLNSGKVKIIKKLVKNETLNKSKEVEFLCVPSVDENHPIIQSTIQQTKSNLSVLYLKDACNSKTTIEKVLPNAHIRKASSGLWFAPKFARMKIMHELLVYVLYHYQGSENLDDEECRKYMEAVCHDLDPKEQLPKCYLKEISWKMFIPPLMKYEEYNDGWISQNDMAERLPLRLFFSLVRLPYHNPQIDAYLNHPIKQYYLIRHLPQDMQQYLTFDRKYVYLLSLNLRNLCTIGLIQFGPKYNVRGNTNLIYLNKRTELMDTRTCPPARSKINPSLNYPIYYYDFMSLKSVESYWNDTMRFCIETKLGRRNVAPETAVKRNKNMPQRLLEAMVSRQIEEAPLNDRGNVPGDRLGAVGFDSWHYSHLIKQWLNNKSEGKQTTVQSANSKSVKQLVKKSRSKLKILRNHKLRKTTLPSVPNKKNRSKSIGYDKTDIEALKKLTTLRTTWTKNEDELLLTCYVASKYQVNPLFPIYKPYKLYRKILHELSERSADKTSESCKRRLCSLLKNPLKIHSVELFIKELAEDTKLKEKSQDIIDEINQYSKVKDLANVNILLDKLTEVVFHYLHSTSAQTSVLIQGTYDLTLPDDIQTFKKCWNYKYAVATERNKILELNTEKDCLLLSIRNLVLSTLLGQVDRAKALNVNFLFTIFKQFSENELKSALNYIRNNKLISYNKCSERQRSCYLPFGKGVYHLSISYHTVLKSTYSPSIYGQVYSRYLELMSVRNREYIEIKNYDVGLNLMLISHLVLNKVDFQFTVPENVLCFNTAPLPYLDPESVMKPMLIAKGSYTDMTLSIIRDSFFADKSKDPNENDKKSSGDEDEYPMSDSDLYDNDEDDKLIDYKSSKIAIFLTRNQFKQSEVRFSNAYDHFLINTFPVKYKTRNFEKFTSPFNVDRANFLKNLQETVVYAKTKYTSEDLMFKIRKFFREISKRDFAINVLEFVRMKGVLGATCAMLRDEFKDLSTLKKVTGILVRKTLIVRCGSQFTHFVHTDFAEYWLIRSWKNKNIFCDESEISSQAPIVINRNKCEEFQSTSSEELIWISMKPWVHFNGTINEPALDSFLIRVLSFVLKKPGSSLKQAQQKFFPALLPHCVRELIEMLEELKCIQLKIFENSVKVSLLSEPSMHTVEEFATGFENEDNIIIQPDVNALAKLSIFLSSTSYKDLIETKYSADMNSTTHQPDDVQQHGAANNEYEEIKK